MKDLTEKPIEKLPKNARRAYEIVRLDIPHTHLNMLNGLDGFFRDDFEQVI